MKALNRDAILGHNDLNLRKVEVPEWGGHVFVKPMTVEQSDALAFTDPKKESVRAKMIVFCTCDEKGNPLFTEDDIIPLTKKSATTINKLLIQINEVNAFKAGTKDDPGN
jgi:hypothetical protein